MPLAGFEPTIPETERPQNHALDRAATGTASVFISLIKSKMDVKKGTRTHMAVLRNAYEVTAGNKKPDLGAEGKLM